MEAIAAPPLLCVIRGYGCKAWHMDGTERYGEGSGEDSGR